MKILSTLLAAGVVTGLLAQTAPARLEFEVASLKSAEGLIAGKAAAGGTRVDGAQVRSGTQRAAPAASFSRLNPNRPGFRLIAHIGTIPLGRFRLSPNVIRPKQIHR